MSSIEKDQVLLEEITDQMVAALVANALHAEHVDTNAVIKRIGRLTGANLHSIRKWYQGLNAPKSAHLLMLAKIYPNVLRRMLETIGRYDAWELCTENEIPEKMESTFYKSSNRDIYSIKFVTINVVVDARVADQFNHRQLWFLGQLQRGNKVKADDIATIWHVALVTAKRDVAGLIKARMIAFMGARKNGWYIVAN